MSESLRQFCASRSISYEQLSGTAPTWNQRSDKYAIAGEGDITGAEVKKSGQFGNNVIQLVHAMHAARRLGLRWVRANGFGSMFRPGSYIAKDGLKILIDQPAPGGESAIAGRFFFWWGTAGLIRHLTPADFVAALRGDMRNIIDLPASPPPQEQPAIHFHLRGGDIFGVPHTGLKGPPSIHPDYVQPPLAYYQLALEDFIQRHPAGRAVIVSMDRANPCVAELESLLRKRSIGYRFCSGSLRDDIAELYSGKEIVAGYGTFVPVVALLSRTVEKLHFFREINQQNRLQVSGIELALIEDICNEYLPKGDWTNSPAQRQKMLDYPANCLARAS